MASCKDDSICQKHLLTLFFLYCQEVDEPLQLDMSELCLDDDFMRGSGEND